jgi:hypothetical protein
MAASVSQSISDRGRPLFLVTVGGFNDAEVSSNRKTQILSAYRVLYAQVPIAEPTRAITANGLRRGGT